MMTTDTIVCSGTSLEYRFIGSEHSKEPTLVFLHEGLGSVSLWRNFPDLLAEKTGLNALVYSRAGYGKSDAVALPRPVSFMHDEAEVLGKLLALFQITESILIGHSDGASIALIYTASQPNRNVIGLGLEAPHVFVERCCIESIAKIKVIYQTTDLPERLRRHHGENTECAFRGWNDVWLDPAFGTWNIEDLLPSITVPVLLIQGKADEYGTMRQVDSIRGRVRGRVEVLTLDSCGHAPHREFLGETCRAMSAFIRSLLT